MKDAADTLLVSWPCNWVISVWISVDPVPDVCALTTSAWMVCRTVSMLLSAAVAVPSTEAPRFSELDTVVRSLFCVRMFVAIDQYAALS